MSFNKNKYQVIRGAISKEVADVSLYVFTNISRSRLLDVRTMV